MYYKCIYIFLHFTKLILLLSRHMFYSRQRLRGAKSQVQRQRNADDPGYGSSRKRQRTSFNSDPW